MLHLGAFVLEPVGLLLELIEKKTIVVNFGESDSCFNITLS